jgi:hypothetical protein
MSSRATFIWSEMVRSVLRVDGVKEVATVAFSLDDQAVYYEQPYSPTPDFPALQQALENFQAFTVDLEELQPGSELRFFDRILERNAHMIDNADAVLILGMPSGVRLRKEDKREMSVAIDKPGKVFYIKPKSRRRSLFRKKDLIDEVVEHSNGKVYTFESPLRFAISLNDVFERLTHKTTH